METRSFAGCSVSVLMLGTAQFGMSYGVANRTGQPAYRDVVAMLKAAIEGGVNCFDTAAAYGCSEELLFRALHELGMADRVVVVTKVRPLTAEELTDSARAARAVEQSVAESRRRLGIDCLPVVLFHRETDAEYLPLLEQLSRRGWLRHAGVSCDHRPGPAARFAEQSGVAALQLPANLLDRRHQQSGVFATASAHGVAVFVRSVYLQGLLRMPEDAIPPALHEVIPARRRLVAIADDAGLTLGELAVRYMLAQHGVTCVLTGVETVAQVRNNVAIVERGPLDGDVVEAVDAMATGLSQRVLTPSLWNEGGTA
jgi:aryl-alcohol dehydrogenase-like predicted oxidoreductase